MTNMFCESAFFGVVISLLAYELGMLLKKKFGLPIFNPLLISIAVVIVFLAVFDINYQNYNDGAKYLSYLLTPATVCLAIPLYEQMEALKKNIKARHYHVTFEPLFDDIGEIDFEGIDWIVIGTETGNRKGKSYSRPEWVLSIAEQAKAHGIPVIMKED